MSSRSPRPLVYGTADFFGGLASRRVAAVVVTFVSQCAGLASLLVVLPVAHGTGLAGADLAWGAAGGLAGAVALVVLLLGAGQRGR